MEEEDGPLIQVRERRDRLPAGQKRRAAAGRGGNLLHHQNFRTIQPTPTPTVVGPSAHAAEGDLDLALKDYDEAIRLDPNPRNWRKGRGFAWHRKGQLEGKAMAGITNEAGPTGYAADDAQGTFTDQRLCVGQQKKTHIKEVVANFDAANGHATTRTHKTAVYRGSFLNGKQRIREGNMPTTMQSVGSSTPRTRDTPTASGVDRGMQKQDLSTTLADLDAAVPA